MSPSYSIDYHYLLENILDIAIQVFLSATCTLCSLLSPLRCPVTPRTSTISTLMTPNSIISTPMTPNSASPTPMTPAPTPGGPREPALSLLAVPTQYLTCLWGRDQKGETILLKPVMAPWASLCHSLYLTLFKIFYYKEAFFFKRIHKNLEKIQRRESVS